MGHHAPLLTKLSQLAERVKPLYTAHMTNVTLNNQTNSPIRIKTTHFGVNVPTSADLVGTDIQIAEVYRDAGLGVLVQGAIPTVTVAPAITGTPEVNATLTVSSGTWTGSPTLTRQWQSSANGTSGWANIAGATGTTRVVPEADLTKFYRVITTGTTPAGSAQSTSNVVGPIVMPAGGL